MQGSDNPDAQGNTALHSNAFFLLGVTTRDNRRRIVEMAEEKALTIDAEQCSRARAELITPRTRLGAEIAWLPGVAPTRAATLVNGLRTHVSAIRQIQNLAPLPHANLMASGFELLDSGLEPSEWASWILRMAEIVDSVDLEDVRRAINEDRAVAGFPEVVSQDLLDAEFRNQRDRYKAVVKEAINRLPSSTLIDVVSRVASESTSDGTKHAPTLVDELVDAYETEIHGFLQKECENIRKLIGSAKDLATKGPATVDELLKRLSSVIANWDSAAQPIQTVMKSRGLEHKLSRQIAHELRNCAIELFNKHDLLTQAKEVTSLIVRHFSEYPETAERIQEDVKALDEISNSRRFEKMIGPIRALCDATAEASEKNPKAAATEANRLLERAPGLFAELSRSGAPAESTILAKNYVAGALTRCAICFGNETSEWNACVPLLELAREYATDTELVAHVAKNLEIVRKNQRLYAGLTPVKSAPGLHTINGIGTTMYGSTDPDPESGSVISTYYFVFVFIPIFPIARYRVIVNGNSYRFLGKAPLRTFDKWHIAISIGVLLWLFLSK